MEAWPIILLVVLGLIVPLAIYERWWKKRGIEIAWDEVVGLIVFLWMLWGWAFALPAYVFFGANLAALLFLVWLVSAITVYLALRLL